MADKPKRQRGRPPQGEFTGKSATLTTRITGDLRARLEDAKGRRSLSQEVERRLWESFDEELKKDRFFGRETNYALFRVFSNAIQGVEMRSQRKWDEDPYTFEQVKVAISTILDELRPAGPVTPPSDWSAKFLEPEGLGESVGLGSVDQLVRLAPDEMPRDRRRRGDEPAITHSREIHASYFIGRALRPLLGRTKR
jgi:hypothetical protein